MKKVIDYFEFYFYQGLNWTTKNYEESKWVFILDNIEKSTIQLYVKMSIHPRYIEGSKWVFTLKVNTTHIV